MKNKDGALHWGLVIFLTVAAILLFYDTLFGRRVLPDFGSQLLKALQPVLIGGVLACLPVLWVLPFASRILKLRISQRSTCTTMGVIVVLIAAGVIVALLDAEMAGILQRYYADFSFMFLAAAVLLVFIVNENLVPGSTMAQVFTKVLLVLVAVSVFYSALICFVPETGWYSDVYSWAYSSFFETVLFWT